MSIMRCRCNENPLQFKLDYGQNRVWKCTQTNAYMQMSMDASACNAPHDERHRQADYNELITIRLSPSRRTALPTPY